MNHGELNPALADAAPETEWLPLLDLARAEVTSESSSAPLRNALALVSEPTGWRAELPGRQTIRLWFEPRRRVRMVRLLIEERDSTRTQELTLRVALSPEGPWREVVRQQFNFSPAGATQELEDYRIDFPAIAGLELVLLPDISGGHARACLQQLRVA